MRRLLWLYCGFKRNKGKLGKLRRDWEELVRVACGRLLFSALSFPPSPPHPCFSFPSSPVSFRFLFFPSPTFKTTIEKPKEEN